MTKTKSATTLFLLLLNLQKSQFQDALFLLNQPYRLNELCMYYCDFCNKIVITSIGN